MLTLIHQNRASIRDGVLRIDRKFHIGMQAFVASLSAPLATVHPEAGPDDPVMDPVEVPIGELGYEILAVPTGRSGLPDHDGAARLAALIQRSRLVAGCGFGAQGMARAAGVPYVMVLEYDLRTQLTATLSEVSNPLRKLSRALRCVAHHYRRAVPDMRGARALHCNGYPIFDATAHIHRNRLLYLDSRMTEDLLVPAADLERRLARLGTAPLRLLFSGRFERMKGADHAVRVGIECRERGLDVELHLYGQGSLRPELDRLVVRSGHGDRIHVHAAIPYPELVERSRTFDLFVCCHIQSDPSCTYLEAFGAGLPIAGYGNRMWRRLAEESGGGVWSRLGRPGAVADDIAKLAGDLPALAAMSRRARAFAAEHTFEREMRRRVLALEEALRGP